MESEPLGGAPSDDSGIRRYDGCKGSGGGCRLHRNSNMRYWFGNELDQIQGYLRKATSEFSTLHHIRLTWAEEIRDPTANFKMSSEQKYISEKTGDINYH